MLKHLLVSLFLLLSFLASSAQKADLKVMTFNIRYDNPSDGEFSWENRKNMVFRVLDDEQPAIIGFQEALKGQVDQIRDHLKGYKSEGVGRDDGRDAGEFSIIFYDSSRFERTEGATFWLSETPVIPGSKSWNSACTRIVTWVRLLDKKQNQQLVIFNTHFDHISEQARVESAKLVSSRMNTIAGKETVILMGDFNSSDTSAAYHFLTGTATEYPMKDTRELAGKNSTGPPYSFVGFPFHPLIGEIIDFIFINQNSDLRVLRNQIIDFHVNGKYPSDHLPVIAEFEYSQKK
jgi:endonuclease/exonuclease/phosphatase family metal-dependent hydrolase